MKPTSTRDTKVECFMCHKYVLVEQSVFGRAVQAPLMSPEHFCKRCAKILSVSEFDPKEIYR